MKTLIVIPTYNECENILHLLDQIQAISPLDVHVLVVDDGSPDGTGQIVDALAMKNPRIYVLHRTQKEGLGKAYIAGFTWGIQNGYVCMVQMDADFSHHPRYLPFFFEHLKEKDLVIGSRYIKGGGTKNWSRYRRLISIAGGMYARWILKAPIHDFTGGFNAWHCSVLKKINYLNLRSNGYSFQIELKYRAFQSGFSIVEIPILFEDRVIGQSKMSFKIILEAFIRVFEFRFFSKHY